MKKYQNILSAVARIVLGAVFMFSGIVKAIDPLGTVYKIEDYLKAFGGVMMELLPLAMVAALALIVAEWMIGVCLVGDVQTKWVKWLVLAFMGVMTPLTLWIALTNPVSDCGCFGDAIVLSNWATLWKNVVLCGIVAILFVGEHGRKAVCHKNREIGIAAAGLVVVLALMTWTLLHLPIIDFRPYKVGNNIPELMEVQEDAPQDEYEIRFVYMKDGVKKEFTLENYPKGDSTWTFVDQKSKLIKKGYEAPIHDFELLNMDYEDITWDVLESEEPVTLIVMYDLDKTNVEQMDKVKEIMQRCDDRLEACYLVTGSGEQDIEDFCWEVEVDENRFCTCDPVTLKTIVRANPGVIVVQNGTIVDKYNVRNK